MVRYSFPVGLFHSLFHAGLSRRTRRSSAAQHQFPIGQWSTMLGSSFMRCPFLRTTTGVYLMASVAAAAEIPTAASILEANCLRCHNPAARITSLSLATSAEAEKGGLHGAAIGPGDPEDGYVLGMLSVHNVKMRMQAT